MTDSLTPNEPVYILTKQELEHIKAQAYKQGQIDMQAIKDQR